MGFQVAGILFGIGLIGLAVCAWWAPARWPQMWRVVPRERIVGGALGLICLVWSGVLVRPMLEGGMSGCQSAVVPAAISRGVGGGSTVD
jgi:hypothetical protein